jgi:hypothetical protein
MDVGLGCHMAVAIADGSPTVVDSQPGERQEAAQPIGMARSSDRGMQGQAASGVPMSVQSIRERLQSAR